MDLVKELLIGGIFWRGIVSPYVAGLIKKYLLAPLLAILKNRYIKTERDLAIWMHYKNKALDAGHDDAGLGECKDGLCPILTAKTD